MNHNITKKLCAAILAVTMTAASGMAVFANDNVKPVGNLFEVTADLTVVETEADLAARAMNAMNLFRGTDNGFELDRAPTRLEALIMLIRMTGNERNIYDKEYASPFEDTPEWDEAGIYLGYAYENGITKGVTPTTFDPNGKADARMYMTFMLRALGYTDTDEATVWDNWKTLSDTAGIIPDSVNLEDFTRGDGVISSFAALNAKLCGSETTLADALLENGTIKDFSLEVARAINGKKADVNSSLSEILASLYAPVSNELGINYMQTTKIDDETLSFFLGVDSLDYEEGIACEPMMSSKAHSVCLVKLKDGADVEQAKKDIKEKVNPNKWICVGVEPENVRVESIGNLVLLVMDDNLADSFVNSFKALVPSDEPVDNTFTTYTDKVSAVDEKLVTKFADKLKSIKETYLKDNRVFYATIPHKSNYLKDELDTYLDHDAINALLSAQLEDWTNIDLTEDLDITDYYTTDTHLKQESYFPMMQSISEAMWFYFDKNAYTAQTVDNFTGAYVSEYPEIEAESIKYFTSENIDNAVVSDFQHEVLTKVYYTDALSSKSMYDLFLNGATPLETITNSNAPEGTELVIFRDSFGSAIAPFFVDSYSKITLVDIRYMASALLPEYVDFGKADVLFLYGDVLVNNSMLLK